ncbi:MAG: succinate dehydrogenase/fumarate reductase iron-sulfur subunit [Verrucomicrobiae bacterium]|nr:succinate dehydrogenase/fumarate reductase iron-sulfur subunit [Verrucomicrobiae bacterium]
MNLKLRVWRQEKKGGPGRFVEYEAREVNPDMSFLEMLDVVNDGLVLKGEAPIMFDSDCREGICGTCSMVINGTPHGGQKATTVCQLHMRHFDDGDTLVIEPWRAHSFPVLRDLVVDREAFDRIIQKGGFVSVNTGQAVEANAQLVPKVNADKAMDAAQCIGCGACVAACKNSSAMLFVGAKVTHLHQMPQGHPERERRVLAMVEQMDREGFGNCSNTYSCEAVCPKEISREVIATLNREYARATLKGVA